MSDPTPTTGPGEGTPGSVNAAVAREAVTGAARPEAGSPPPGDTPAPPPSGPSGRFPTWLKGVTPLVLLAGFVTLFLQLGPLGLLERAFPPIEELTIQRIALPQPGTIEVRVVNGGPEPVTVAQVLVDEAAWSHSLDGPRTIPRLGSRTVTIPYPWVEGEPHEIVLVTSTGVTFSGEIAVATESPQPDWRYLSTFAFIGIYVGVIPVLLGLLWLPFLREIRQKWIDFFLALTMGLLVFLGVDALEAALETSAAVPGAFQGLGLVVLGFVSTPFLLAALAGGSGGADSGGVASGVPALEASTGAASIPPESASRGSLVSPLRLATLIALGIGLHNLGEGLAIGGAYATGEIALGKLLVIGFLLHNTTEGLGIVAPIAGIRPSLTRLALLGAIAGIPTIFGAWIGGFTYSPTLITLFFAIGAGAIVQVVYELWKFFSRGGGSSLGTPLNAAGLILGLVIMYVTGLFVAA